MTATNEHSREEIRANFYEEKCQELLTEVHKLYGQIKKERIFYFISIIVLLTIQIIVCLG